MEIDVVQIAALALRFSLGAHRCELTLAIVTDLVNERRKDDKMENRINSLCSL